MYKRQLQIWAERAGCELVRSNEGADPGAVLFDALAAAKARDMDVVLDVYKRQERESTAKRAEDLQRLKADLSGDRSTRENMLEDCRQAIAAADEEIEQRQETIAALHARQQTLRDRLTALDQEKIALEAERLSLIHICSA